MPFIKKMPAIEHFEVVLMFKTVKNPPTVKSPSPTLAGRGRSNSGSVGSGVPTYSYLVLVHAPLNVRLLNPNDATPK